MRFRTGDGMEEKISKKQAVCLSALFVVSGIPILSGYSVAGRNLWLAYIISFAAAVPFYFIYARLSEIYPEKNIFGMLTDIFGKTFGRILSAVYTLYYVNIAAIAVRNISEFTGIVSLDKTPRIFIIAVCVFVCFYVAVHGLEVMAKFSTLFLPVLAVVMTVFFACSFNIWNFDNLEPLTVESPQKLFQNAYVNLVFPATEAMVLLNLGVRSGKGERKKVYFTVFAFSLILMVAVAFNNILSLGVPTMTRLFYPTYAAVSLIEIGVVRRLEIIASVLFFTAGILKGSLSVYISSLGIKNCISFAGKRGKTLVILFISVAVAIISELLFPNIIELPKFLGVYVHIAAALQFFPVIMWITAEIKLKKNGNKIVNKADNKS